MANIDNEIKKTYNYILSRHDCYKTFKKLISLNQEKTTDILLTELINLSC